METKRFNRIALIVTLMVTVALFMCMTGCKSVPEDTSTPKATTSVVITPTGGEFPNINIASSDGSVITCEKTSEVEVIAKGTTVTVKKETPDSWPNYNGEGVFILDREVTLSSFIMGKYEVTQKLYQAVMGTNPSSFSDENNPPATNEKQAFRPVEKVTWYDAVVFCNELTKLTMNDSDCVYTITNKKQNKETQNITAATVTADYTKKGYRLPTEAEWEFAARGGDPTADAWMYAYAGVQTEKALSAFAKELHNDEKLDAYGWYGSNAGGKTHEVGKLQPNRLGLYDMSGNVYEWCYDWDGDITTTAEVNPLGATSGSNRVRRGGCWDEHYNARECTVSNRNYGEPFSSTNDVGFRVCRSQ